MVRILVNVDILQRRWRTRIRFWASKSSNPCQRQHYVKAFAHETSVLSVQGCESLSTSTFCKGDGARDSRPGHPRVRVPLNVTILQRRWLTRFAFWASRGANLAKAMSRENSVLGIQECEPLRTSTPRPLPRRSDPRLRSVGRSVGRSSMPKTIMTVFF